MKTTDRPVCIFLGSKEKIRTVYNSDITDALVKSAEIDADKVFTREDVIAAPEVFSETKYIFSTWGMPVFSREEISLCFPKLSAVFYAAGSVRSFAAPFLESGVKVFSAWAANAVPVAEFTVSEILLANKGYFKGIHTFSETRSKKSAALSCREYPGNYGISVGLIGCGMIGSMVAGRLVDIGIDVLVFDPFLDEEKALNLGVKKVELEDIFSGCSVISNHLANNPQTVDMLNYSLFSLMPKNSTFINTGRGAQVNEPDLIRFLVERPDVTALLDVTYPEPPAKDSPLFDLENVILTPHIAGSMGNEVWRMAEYMLKEFRCYISGEPIKYSVSLKMLETMA